MKWESGPCSPAFERGPEAIDIDSLVTKAGHILEGLLYDIHMRH